MKYCFLDKDNIFYRKIDGEWIGKPVVWITPYKAGWAEDLELED
jgi:hypothetical protein